MIRDLADALPGSTHAGEVCIVGGGAAGIALALFLRRRGMHVLLLEGGGTTEPSNTLHTTDSLHADTPGLPFRGVSEGRAHVLGGTTTLWGGQILPLTDLDFAPRDWVPGSGWPINRADLQDFYEQALGIEGLAKTVRSDDEVWEAVGERRPQFQNLDTYVSRWCPEPNFARLHHDELAGNGIDVWTHARVVRLELHGDTVRGITARTPGGAQHTFRARNVVFCLGAIESNRFFLQAHNGPMPWNESGLLGCHFQDHIDCDAATLRVKDGRALQAGFDAFFVKGQKYLPKLRLTEAAQRERRLLHVGATIYAPVDEASAALRKSVAQTLRGRPALPQAHSLRALPVLAKQGMRYLTRGRGSLQVNGPLRLRVHCEQEPAGASRITLTRERDMAGMRKAAVTWAVSDVEIATIRQFTELAAASLANVVHVQPHPALRGEAEDFRSACQDSFHHMGGMRMHASPKQGVVDTDLRLHGTANCYVCSAAVYPTSGFSNPTHTLLALAARLAQHLGSA